MGQDAYDSSWEAAEEKEGEKKDAPKSSVAQRTRSKTGERRKKETTLFLGEGDSTMGSMLEESVNPMDSIIISKDRVWKNEKEWKKGINDLNTTLDRANEMIDLANSSIKAVKDIRSRKTNGEPEVVDLENENEKEDIVKRKRVTFLIE